jgi:hypothetical protein
VLLFRQALSRVKIGKCLYEPTSLFFGANSESNSYMTVGVSERAN